MELEVTWGRALRVWWAFFWRNLVGIVIAVLLSAVIGALLNVVLSAAGVSPETVSRVAMPFGVMLGIAASVVPIKLILGRGFGDFRLVLVSRQP